MAITIAETNEYASKAFKLLTESEQMDIIDYLSIHPKAGVLIQGTGGIRKLRWKQKNKGKSGGVRIIYYYHNEQMPLYLLTLFAKSERANIDDRDKKTLTKLTKLLVKFWLENRNERCI